LLVVGWDFRKLGSFFRFVNKDRFYFFFIIFFYVRISEHSNEVAINRVRRGAATDAAPAPSSGLIEDWRTVV